MGEMSKQVSVNNWGMCFLDRLHKFFNKTEYCDLTLQFEGNVQLKVHRLVVYACTEYFHVLENTCTMTDDILIMPPDLQADVIVPIVNFMYTGVLDFQYSMFDKLYHAATLMNMTILTKLLDHQRKPFVIKAQMKKTPNTPEKKSPVHKLSTSAGSSHLPPTLPGRKIPVWKRKVAPTHTPEPTVNPLMIKPRAAATPTDPLAIYDNTPKPTRFEWPEEDLSAFNPLDSTFDDISYTSRPLLTEEDELKACSEEKRAALIAAKHGNKAGDGDEYVREQKMRFAFDDDESMDTDEISAESSTTKRKIEAVSPTSSTSTHSKRVRFNLGGEKENKEKKFSITTSGKATDMDHTKIISELLKKYPDLVKKNKNIRLKIMAKGSSGEKNSNTKSISKVRVQLSPKQGVSKVKAAQDPKKDEGPWTCNICSSSEEQVEFVLYYLYRKHMTDVHNEKFDSRMCRYCGHKSQKHNMLMYHMYTKHGVKPPPAYNFPKCNRCNYVALTEALLFKHQLNHTKYELQCRECKIAFVSLEALGSHMEAAGHTSRGGKTNYNCQYCGKLYQSGSNLFSHMRMQHRADAKRDGVVNIDDVEEETADDGNDDDTVDTKQSIREEDEYITPEIINETKSKEKFKILQNVKVPIVSQQDQQQQQEETAPISLEPSSEAEALSNVASGIATSLGLVDIVVLNDNQQYILQSNEHQLQNNQPEFILPELNTTQFTENQTLATNEAEINAEHNVIAQSMLNSGDIASTDELVMVLTDHDYGDGNNELITNDNSNIVVLYSHPVDGQENQFITSQGNLMVNSQTGMIEIRNSTINTSTANTIVVTQAQDTPIESIEMIQQEINSQLQHDEQPEQVGETANELVNEQEQPQQQFTTESAGGEIQEQEPQLEQQQQEQEPQEEPMVQPEVEEKTEEENAVEKQASEEVQQEAEQQPAAEAEEEKMELTEQLEPLVLEEEQPQPPNLEEQPQEIVENQPAATPDETPQNEETTAPQLTPEPETVDEPDTPNKNLEMPVLEEEAEPAPTVPTEEDINKDEGVTEKPPEQNNQTPSEDSAQLETFETGDETVAPPTTKISILDDWEDTDSQQSEQSRAAKPAATGNTVNKLMDDWADEEDDESKRNAN